MLIRILQDYGASEGWRPGEVVEATFDPSQLVAEGKVEVVEWEKTPTPVSDKQLEEAVAAEEVTAVPGTSIEGS